jgi:hypothetical protein
MCDYLSFLDCCPFGFDFVFRRSYDIDLVELLI